MSIVRTVLLPASETPDQMTEIQRMVREIAGITRADLDTPNRTLTLRASPQAVAVATQLIDQMEEPLGEMILEIEILEVDRSFASQIGITPPQSSKVFTLNTQQLQEAQQGGQSLINVISQIFGLPSAFSGLSMSQLATLIASNQISAAALLAAAGGVWRRREHVSRDASRRGGESFADAFTCASRTTFAAESRGWAADDVFPGQPHSSVTGAFFEQPGKQRVQHRTDDTDKFSDHKLSDG